MLCTVQPQRHLGRRNPTCEAGMRRLACWVYSHTLLHRIPSAFIFISIFKLGFLRCFIQLLILLSKLLDRFAVQLCRFQRCLCADYIDQLYHTHNVIQKIQDGRFLKNNNNNLSKLPMKAPLLWKLIKIQIVFSVVILCKLF